MKQNQLFKVSSLIVALILCLCACTKAPSAFTWQEQYDLGVRYLSEGNYQEAILAFTAAIEIDPKKADAYLGLADAYVAAGDTDAAKDILQKGYDVTGDEGLSARMEELELALQAQALDTRLAQGELVPSTDGPAEYRYYCINGVPQPMGIHEENGITETVMAYMRQEDDNGNWSEWEPAPHYWAELRCTACGDDNAGEMPDWFKYAFSHAWSGEWKTSPKVYDTNGNTVTN